MNTGAIVADREVGDFAAATVEVGSPHRLEDLRYRLLRGPVALEPLRILEWRDITVGAWQVRLHILGASHAVRLTRGAEVITEVFACGTVRADGATRLLELRPPEVGVVEGQFPPGAPVGRVEIERFDLTATGDGLIGSIEVEDQMMATFPLTKSAVRSRVLPRTRIGWRVVDSRLGIETVHSYPEENAGVRSRTNFLLGEAKR